MCRRRHYWLSLIIPVTAALLLAACSPTRSGAKPAGETHTPAAKSPGASAPNAAAQPLSAEDQQVVDWLAARAIPLKSLTADSGLDDLQPLKEKLQGVRVVALGEATHGTHEFFTMKHRMLEFLVKEMGVKAFLIEDNYPTFVAMNQVVLNNTGSPQEVLRSAFWVWQTDEVVALADWLKQYNQGVPAAERVQFLGFDIQDCMRSSAYLQDFLKGAAPAYGEKIKETFQEIQDDYYVQTGRRVKPSTPPDKAAWSDRLQELITYLEQQRQPLIAATSTDRYETALAMARNLLRYTTYKRSASPAERIQVRDRLMAETVLELLNQLGPDAKVMLWAHNAHVSNYDGVMGNHLRAALGDAYYSFGFAFDHGSFNTLEENDQGQVLSATPKAFSVGPAPAGQMEWYFARAGLGNSIVDFRSGTKSDAVSAWLAQARPMWDVGSQLAPSKSRTSSVPPNLWDGLIYIPETTPSKLLPLH